VRPHRLRLTAFGPFAGTVEVDLDALAQSGLFLLHGETGAGKTTLLDGLGFALFGRVPGVRAEAKRLRSDHASATTRTEVQLEATLAGRRVRVTRSPEQVRPKVRGTGTTSEPAKVLLEEHDGTGWRTVSTRVGEADRELSDLVGMSAEQFFQVVLLPQGDFARFLRAGSDDRAKLLERLFSTDRFRAVEHWLADRRRTTAAARDAAAEALGRLVARVAEVAGVDEPEPAPPGWAEALAAQAAAQASTAGDASLRCQAALDQAQAADAQARQLAERQGRRRLALEQLAALQDVAPAVAAVERELAAAQRAAEVADALDDATERAAAVTAAEQQEAAARAGLPAALRGADVDGLRAARSGAAERLGRLAALQDDADRADEEDAAAASAQAAAEALGREAQRLDALLAALPARREAAADRLRAAQDAAVRLPTARAQADRVRALVSDAEALSAARAVAAALRAEHLSAREAAADAREHGQALREARVEGMVAELAATLVDGDPCLVCGSPEHPDPSYLQGARVSRDDEDAATAAADRLRAAAEEVGARAAAAAARVDELTSRVGDADLAALTGQATSLAEQTRSLATAAEQLPAAEAEVAAVDAERATALARASAVAAEAGAAREQATAATARAQTARAAVLAGLDGDADLPAALRAGRELVEALDAALVAVDAATAARQEAVRALERAAQASARAGFADASEAAAARRADAEREQAAVRVAAHREAEAAVGAVLAEPELDVPLDPPADAAATAVVVAERRAAQSAAEREAGRLRARAEQLAALAPQVGAAVDALAPLAATAAEVKALADLANGQGANTLRMTLSAYVLAARLEEVAAAASERLLRMTQGRYSLVHTDTGRGAGRSGLGLLARDTWTGQDRDTGTLSGGETFLASLSLALGLADVVAAEAGGARTEALFVDEGFGTLDEETLEEVMDVLDGLREGGRLVGVVSHVAELKQRIPAQVHVRKGRTGSDVALLGC
jgi:exonuclease SbcC